MRADIDIEGVGGGLPVTRRRPRRLSHLFVQFADRAEGRVRVADILDALGDRSFAALLVLFAAFNLLPLPPGASAVLGLPLLIVAAQMMAGCRRAWLPRFIAEKSMPADQFKALMARIVPRLVTIERYVRPRWWPFWRRRGDRVIGTLAFLLAVIVTLPIPLGNWLPALAVFLMGLALSERDGIIFVAGCGVGVAALAVVAAVFGTATAAAQAVYGWLF